MLGVCFGTAVALKPHTATSRTREIMHCNACVVVVYVVLVARAYSALFCKRNLVHGSFVRLFVR